MFGCQATLPVDLEIQKSTPEEEAERYNDMEEPDMAQIEQERNLRLEEAKANILKAQKKQKEQQYDKKHAKPDLFKKGQLVLKKDSHRKKRKGGKLDKRFLGPYIIHKKLGWGGHELIAENGEEKVRATGHYLKPYFRTCSPSSMISTLFLVVLLFSCMLQVDSYTSCENDNTICSDPSNSLVTPFFLYPLVVLM